MKSDHILNSASGTQLPKSQPPSSCTKLELQLLAYLTEHHYLSKGKICDLGCANGGSTYALCVGLDRNVQTRDKDNKVHAFDWFVGSSGSHVGNTQLDLFWKNLQGFEQYVILHDGNILDFSWEEGDIEILFIDIAKERNIFKSIVQFFYFVIPGYTTIIHQDFGRPRLPWLHYSTAYLLPYIEIQGTVDDSLVFIVKERFPSDVLKRLENDEFTVDEKIHLIDKITGFVSQDITKEVRYKTILELSRAYVYYYAKNWEKAKEITAPLIEDRLFYSKFKIMIDRILG